MRSEGAVDQGPICFFVGRCLFFSTIVELMSLVSLDLRPSLHAAARLWRRDDANHGEAIRDITEYIVGFYNNNRLRSKLDIFRRPFTNGQWHQNHLSRCPACLLERVLHADLRD
jgi:hypothetical protein